MNAFASTLIVSFAALALTSGQGFAPPLPAANPRLQTSHRLKNRATPVATLKPDTVRKTKLDGLYGRLARTHDAKEGEAIIASIHNILMQSGSATADLLMTRANQLVRAGKDEVAKQLYDQIVALNPNWAEAWNQRATFRYLSKDDAGSMSDIARALQLEPRHVGAMMGMGYILERRGLNADALIVFKAVMKIDPTLEDLAKKVKNLDLKVKGKPI